MGQASPCHVDHAGSLNGGSGTASLRAGNHLGGTSGCWKRLSPWVGAVFLERAAWIGESSHALRRRCFSEHHISGRCQRQMSSLFLLEHVWVCLLLEKGYKRAAAISGWFLSGHVVQIRLSGVKKGKFAEQKWGFLCVETSVSQPSQLEDILHLPADWA